VVAGRVLSLHRLAVVAALLAPLVSAPPAAQGADPAGATRIYNGTPTGEFPAVAALAIVFEGGETGFCTATLIAPDILLTAAHCLEGNVLAASAVFVADGVPLEEHPGTRYVRHSEYADDVAAFADIALVLLAQPVTTVTPMPFATALPRPRTKAAIVGYGYDGIGDIGTKRVGEVRVKRCPKALRKAGLQKGQLLTSICWKPKRNSGDTCRGDSGGPLIIDGAVVGVTSGGFPDCPGKLSWDTNVPLFSQWIPAAIDYLRQPPQ
jgi:trypsin